MLVIETQKFDKGKNLTSALERIYLNSFMSLSNMYVILIGSNIIIFLMWVWAALCMVCSVGRQGLYIAFYPLLPSPRFPPPTDMKKLSNMENKIHITDSLCFVTITHAQTHTHTHMHTHLKFKEEL